MARKSAFDNGAVDPIAVVGSCLNITGAQWQVSDNVNESQKGPLQKSKETINRQSACLKRAIIGL
jgi:hypothetical protein